MRPRFVIVRVNLQLPPWPAVAGRYIEDAAAASRDGSGGGGASLGAFATLLSAQGYSVVHCTGATQLCYFVWTAALEEAEVAGSGGLPSLAEWEGDLHERCQAVHRAATQGADAGGKAEGKLDGTQWIEIRRS